MKDTLRKLIRSEIRKAIKEAYGMESIYYSAPSGFEQGNPRELQIKRFDNVEKWKIEAMQRGATIQDRGDDWIAVMPNQDKLGTFSKMNLTGTLTV